MPQMISTFQVSKCQGKRKREGMRCCYRSPRKMIRGMVSYSDMEEHLCITQFHIFTGHQHHQCHCFHAVAFFSSLHMAVVTQAPSGSKMKVQWAAKTFLHYPDLEWEFSCFSQVPQQFGGRLNYPKCQQQTISRSSKGGEPPAASHLGKTVIQMMPVFSPPPHTRSMNIIWGVGSDQRGCVSRTQ